MDFKQVYYEELDKLGAELVQQDPDRYQWLINLPGRNSDSVALYYAPYTLAQRIMDRMQLNEAQFTNLMIANRLPFTYSHAYALDYDEWVAQMLIETVAVQQNCHTITVKEAGKKGGSARSEKKAQAARENGKKGGRPKTK